MRPLTAIACVAVLGLIGSIAVAGGSPGTAFTYQGLLNSGGSPFNGDADFTFRAFSQLSGGAELDSVSVADVPVVDGLFTVDVDFGDGLFIGAPRFLQVEVNGQTLSPRQPMLPTPYAMHADSVGSVPSSALSGTYTEPVTFNNAANALFGTGANITGLNAGNISAGTLGAAFLPSGGSWNLGSALSIDANTLAVDAVTNRVGIGTGAPQAMLHVAGNVKIDGSIVIAATSRTYSIGHVEFEPSSHAEGYVKMPTFLQGTVVGQAVVFLAPVHLPQGATVDQFDAYVFDNNGAQNMSMVLARNALNGSGSANMAIVTTSGTTGAPQTLTTTTITNAIIDNETYTYFLIGSWFTPNPPPTIAIYGARLKYTVTTPLP